jgi:hypothetical protein
VKFGVYFECPKEAYVFEGFKNLAPQFILQVAFAFGSILKFPPR